VKLGRVVGNVVSTIHTPVYEGRRLLVCDLLDEHRRETGDYLIAVDTVGSGYDETVLILDEGNSARQVLAWEDGEIRALVVGVVDRVDLG
jgi:microcompartment protein CcmK/EutM